MSLDDSELRKLSSDLGLVPNGLKPKVKAVVKRGALNVKRTMQKDMSASPYFKSAAQSIDFEETQETWGGDIAYGAEIGPNKDRHKSAGLAGIAYFGGSNGGGGTVRDPAEALAEEAPNFEKYLLDVLEGLL